MIAGDIKIIEKKPIRAEDLYRDAEREQEMYGGELDYQIDWRIGLALLRKAELQKAKKKMKGYRLSINLARYRFTKLTEHINVANGRLYGEYGLALISEQEHSTREAGWRLRRVLKEIEARHGENHVLLKLATSSYQGLTNRSHI